MEIHQQQREIENVIKNLNDDDNDDDVTFVKICHIHSFIFAYICERGKVNNREEFPHFISIIITVKKRVKSRWEHWIETHHIQRINVTKRFEICR